MFSIANRAAATIYDRVCEDVYLPFLDRIKSAPVDEYLKEAKRNLRLEPEELLELQERRLEEHVRFAANRSSYWRSRFEASGLLRGGIYQREAFQDLPLLSKAEILDGPSTMFTSADDDEWFRATTSGSTGLAMSYAQDKRHFAWGLACSWRGRSWWRVERGCRQLTLWARPLDDDRKSDRLVGMKYRLRNSFQINTFESFDERVFEEIIEIINRFKPELIYGYGSSLGRLGKFLADERMFLEPAVRPKLIEYTADHMYEEEVSQLSRFAGAPVTSAYGAGETPGLAQQCWAGNSHISIDGAVVEFLTSDGSRAQPGELAEIVVTPLFERSFPLFRYRVGDLGSYKTGRCRCGSPLPMMELKVGKAVDLISTSTKSDVSAHVLDYINIKLMKLGIDGIQQFFVEQLGRDEFRLDFVRSSSDPTRAVDFFKQEMRKALGTTIDIQVREVSSIPSSGSGKRRYFKSSLPS